MIKKIFILGVMLTAITCRSVLANEIKDIRMWHAPDHSRIVFDMTESTPFKVFSLKAPARIVVDLNRATLLGELPESNVTGDYFKRIRIGNPDKSTTRLVFDVSKQVRYYVQVLKPAHGYRYRLVVDLYDRDRPEVSSKRPVKSKKRSKEKHKILVMIDPGHGGEDRGASGRRSHEKNIVLQIAKRVRSEIDALPGVNAQLTRKGDYYVSLRKRTDLARVSGADLFISIHADAFRNKKARGASVYALSQRGATSEAARWLANKENASDLAGGVSLADKDILLAEVLLDLSMTKTVSESISFGREILNEFQSIGKVHSKRVEQATFVVLKSPDIPSVLVETAYITNPTEEKLLRSNRHQKKIARAITRGVKRYLKKSGQLYAYNQ